MPSQIRPNRLEVSDRFPMLGFTIKTDGEGKRYEVVIASDATLFQSGAKAKRTKTNFYSSRAMGLQPIDRGEAVYVLPPEVLARFVGQDKLYYALATYPNGKTTSPEITPLPSEGSAYINLKGLSGRSLRRVRVLPSRQRLAAGYGNGAGTELEWAGDAAMPGTQPVSNAAPAPANGKPNGATAPAQPNPQAAALAYNDGFGPLPPPYPPPVAPPRRHGQAAGLGTDEIPLDPGIGGMSISADALQVGDIILSTTSALDSRAIRVGSGSQVSHAMLYVGQGGQVIEAIGSGVRLMPLDQAIGPATVAVAFRQPNLTDTQRQQIADAAAPYIGRDYDYVGIVRQALFQLDSAVCSMLPESAQATCRQWAGRIDLGTTGNDEFFCSELVIAAYQAAGVPLTATPPHWTSPEDLAEMSLRSGALAYVGHLKAPPLVRSRSIFEVFGMGLSAAGGNGSYLPTARNATRPAYSTRSAYSKGLAVATPIPTDQARAIQLPRAREADTWERVAIEAALVALSGPMAPTILALRALASSQNISIGVGPSAGVGFVMGMGVGVGVIFAPGGRIGIYGQLDVRAGLLDSLSAGLQVTFVRGGIDSFNEVAFAIGGSFVEGVEATIQVLLSPEHGFRGVSFELGVGLAVEPFEIFGAIEGSISQQMAGAQALSAQGNGRTWRRTAYSKGLAIAAPVPVDQARPVQLPRAREAETWERLAIEAAVAVLAGPMAPAILGLRALANSQGVSVGIGPSAGVGFVMGMGVGAGIIFAPRGSIGVYGQLDVRAGILDSISAGVQVTIVRGGIDSFNEVAFAVGVSFVEIVEATVQALLSPEHGFRGVSFELGVGLAVEPFEIFGAVEGSISQQVVGAQALANECYSLNWDEVELIPQPNNFTCWATAAAMVIGWRDRVSLTPETVAQICGRSQTTGITADDIRRFAGEIGLEAEPPQSYTIDGFRNLLESYGPLWVSVQLPGSGHAIVVTGMYSDGAADGSDTFVRISDPLDRVVGTPGSPGAYPNTHNTGSRYIMSWAAFSSEYEQLASAAADGTVNVQILHSPGNHGRQPGRSGAAGYAMAAAVQNGRRASIRARAQAAESFSINWDEVQQIPQPTGCSCWATAAAMVLGWRDRVSLDPETVAEMAGRTTASGVDASERRQLAADLGLAYEEPQSYTIDGFRSLLENNGPLWVGVAVPNGHAIVVTGMYSDGAEDGSDTYVRITDPWDRVVGSPGAPGGYLSTHDTGSRYIMSWAAFTTEYEQRASSTAGTVNVQITHAAGTGGRQPSRSGAAGYAMAAALSQGRSGLKLPPPPTPVVRARAMNAVAIASTIVGAAMTQISNPNGSITWVLDQLRGMKHPNNTPPSPAAPFQDAPTIRLDTWPLVEAADGDEISAWFSVDWQFNGKSVGNVAITNVGTNNALLWKLRVEAKIMDDDKLYPSGNPTFAALRIRFHYQFTRLVGSDSIAVRDLHLYGDGSFDSTGHWEQY